MMWLYRRTAAVGAVLLAVGSSALVSSLIGCQRPAPRAAGVVPADAAANPAVAAVGPTPGPAPAPVPSKKAAKVEPAPAVPVVELRGGGAALGAAHGSALGGQIKLLHDAYLKRYIRGEFARYLALTAAEGFENQLPADYREEVAALAKGAGMTGREMMLGQCFLDISGMVACSTITLGSDASPDGVARFGRNLDFPSLGVADKYTTLFVYHPDGKYAFASVGWPGLIGVLSGMNEHGLTVANMEVTRPPRLPQALPYTLLYRKVLEECRTTEEAVELLKRTPRQSSNNLMIMDAGGNRALAEISPEKVTVRRPDAFGLISTNHRRGTDDHSSAGRCDRYDSLRHAAEEDAGRIDVPRLREMLADASPGKMTLQSMVFEPSNRVIYLSAGANAARGTFRRIDLGTYFAGGNAE